MRASEGVFQQHVDGLLDVSAKYREQIYAWEVMNEPVWLCFAAFSPVSRSWWFDRAPEVSFAQMSDFLEEGIARINSYKFASTVGHRFRADLHRFLTGSLPQFHHYAKPLLGREIYFGSYKTDPPVFGWSFYRQGTSGETSSADEFLDAALRWFGDPNPRLGTAWEKGERLAKLISHRRTLLVLDGSEPLQNAPGPKEGRLRETSLHALLRELAAFNRGLCVIFAAAKKCSEHLAHDVREGVHARKWNLIKLGLARVRNCQFSAC